MAKFLGVLICLFIAATAYMSTTVAKRQEVLRHAAHHNDSWSVAQAVSEFLRLEAEIAILAMPGRTQPVDDARLRLDIMLSRLDFFQEGTLKEFLQETDQRRETVQELHSIVNELDQTLERTSDERLLVLLRRMHELNSPMASISSQAVQKTWGEMEANLESLQKHQEAYNMVVGFLILCWAVLVILMVRHNLLLKKAQHQAAILNDNLSSVGQELLDKNKRLEYVAHHDALTGLPNRILFWDELEAILKNAPSGASELSLLLFDLDNFKSINDTMGHDVGDMLLEQVSDRFHECTDQGYLFCRLGGDEFACLLLGRSPMAAKQVAIKLAARIQEPYQLMHREIRVGCSVGLTHADFPKCDDAKLLFKRADISLYRAKSGQDKPICMFRDYMQAEFDDRKALENDLRTALERDEFKVLYQAQVCASTLEPRGFEALVRWNHPTRGEISPIKFIPIAEELGLIGDLGKKILRIACREATTWTRPLRIAVNLSPLQLQTPDIVQNVIDILEETGLPAAQLELEITETVLLKDPKNGSETLNRLRDIGVSIAMDDFGTGYSSLAILRDIPFDTIKLDKSFVRDLSVNPEAEAFVKLVVDIGNHLRKTVVIEGIETTQQYEIARRIGCDITQGFLFARPVPAEKLAYLRKVVQTSPLG